MSEQTKQRIRQAIARRKAEGLGWGRKKANAPDPSVTATVHAGDSGDVLAVISQKMDALSRQILTLQAEWEALKKAKAILEGGTV